jgi:hypothetical protein
MRCRRQRNRVSKVPYGLNEQHPGSTKRETILERSESNRGRLPFLALGVQLVSEIRQSRETIEPDHEQPKRQAEPFLTADLHLSLHSDCSGDRPRARARCPASIEPNTREQK